jgi:hypothetical protein
MLRAPTLPVEEASYCGIVAQTGLVFRTNGACAAAKLWQHGSVIAVDIAETNSTLQRRT